MKGSIIILLLFILSRPTVLNNISNIDLNNVRKSNLENIRRRSHLGGYFSIVESIKLKQCEFRKQYINEKLDAGREPIIKECREYVYKLITDKLAPAWIGTTWGFNGTSKTPGKGKISCGVFVTTVLGDAGFHVDRIKMAQQPSEYIIKNMVEEERIKRFSNNSIKKIRNYIKAVGKGIYIVGLDCHVGFIFYDGKNNLKFCHSSYYNPPFSVVIEEIDGNNPLNDSKYRVIGKILDDEMIIKWMNGKEIRLAYNYFKRGKKQVKKIAKNRI